MLNAHDRSYNIEIVTDISLRYSLLEKIKHSGSLLTITTPDSPNQYVCNIIAIDDQNDVIHLDGTYPNNNGKAAETPKKIIAETRLSGVRIKFSTDILRTISNKDYTSWLARIPKQIEYHQKRSAHRVWIGIGFNIKLSLDVGEHKILARRVTDLSIDGVGFMIDQIAQPLLKKDQEYDCLIEVGENTLFETTLKICHTENMQKFTKVGSRLQNLSTQEKNRLFRILLDIERDNIRRKTR